MQKRKHVTLTIQNKLDIIAMIGEGNLSRQHVACQFGIGKSTAHDIYKRRDQIIAFAKMHNADAISKRRRVDTKNFFGLKDISFKEEEPVVESAEVIDSIDEFEYQEINEQDYEIVYETSIPVVTEENTADNTNLSLKVKRRSKNLTFREKYNVIQQVENGVAVHAICEEYGIGRTTVYDIVKRKDDIIEFINKAEDSDRKTFKKSKYPEVEERLLEFCESVESFTKQDFYESAKIAFENARENGTLSPSGFCGSWSWAKRFFHRHPELKRKLVTASGQPVDPLELSLSNIEYLDENITESVEAEKILCEEVFEVTRNDAKRIKYLNLGEKLQVLDDIEAGKPIPSIATKYGVSKTTIYEIFKRRIQLRETKLTSHNYLRKVIKLPRYPQIELELLRWCLNQKSFPLSNVMIADKALCIFDELNLKGSFKPSSAWAKKFVLRHPELCIRQNILFGDIQEVETEIDAEEEFHDEEEEQTEEPFQEIEPEEADYHEEYIVEELEAPNEEIMESETIAEEAPIITDDELSIKVEKESPTVPDKIALKSLKILIKYSEQKGDERILSELLNYQKQLQENVTWKQLIFSRKMSLLLITLVKSLIN